MTQMFTRDPVTKKLTCRFCNGSALTFNRVDRAYDANDLYNASQGRWPK